MVTLDALIVYKVESNTVHVYRFISSNPTGPDRTTRQLVGKQ